MDIFLTKRSIINNALDVDFPQEVILAFSKIFLLIYHHYSDEKVISIPEEFFFQIWRKRDKQQIQYNF